MLRLLTTIAALLAGLSSIALAAPKVDGRSFVSMSRTACFGMCPAYSLTVWGDGRFRYIGKGFVRVEGEHKGKISRDDIVVLFSKLREMHFFSLHSVYGTESDAPGITMTVKLGGRIKTVRDFGGFGGTSPVRELAYFIDNLINVSRFVGRDYWPVPVERVRHLFEPETPPPQVPQTSIDFPVLPYTPAIPSLQSSGPQH